MHGQQEAQKPHTPGFRATRFRGQQAEEGHTEKQREDWQINGEGPAQAGEGVGAKALRPRQRGAAYAKEQEHPGYPARALIDPRQDQRPCDPGEHRCGKGGQGAIARAQKCQERQQQQPSHGQGGNG